MKSPEQVQTSETFHDDPKIVKNLGSHALPVDKISEAFLPNLLTSIGEDGVTGRHEPRRAYTSQSAEYDMGELSPSLDDEAIDLLERMRLEMIAEQAQEKLGEELVGEALATYDLLKQAIDLPGYDDRYVVTSFAPDERNEDETVNVDTHETESNSSASFITDYVTRLYIKNGNVEKTLSYPVPYKHGNGILIARENGSQNLLGIEELLNDPTVTKQEIRILAEAVRVNHVGTAESVRARVEANLTMPLATFTDDRARKHYLRKISQ